jgi:hypothetical protein
MMIKSRKGTPSSQYQTIEPSVSSTQFSIVVRQEEG